MSEHNFETNTLYVGRMDEYSQLPTLSVAGSGQCSSCSCNHGDGISRSINSSQSSAEVKMMRGVDVKGDAVCETLAIGTVIYSNG